MPGGSALVAPVGTDRTGTWCGRVACWRAVWNSRCKSCWVTCTYRRVMRMSLWPSNCIRAGRLTPRRSISEAKVCLSRCGVTAHQVRLDGVAIGSQIVKQTAEAQQVVGASLVAQRRIWLAHPAEPAEQV